MSQRFQRVITPPPHVFELASSRLPGELNLCTPLQIEYTYYADLESAHPAIARQ